MRVMHELLDARCAHPRQLCQLLYRNTPLLAQMPQHATDCRCCWICRCAHSLAMKWRCWSMLSQRTAPCNEHSEATTDFPLPAPTCRLEELRSGRIRRESQVG